MANAVKWSALIPEEVGITGTSLGTLADGSNRLGLEYDNSTAGNRNMYADFIGKWTFTGAPAANAFMSLYLLGAPDGSNYEYGSDVLDPSANSLVGTFTVPLLPTTNYSVLKHILLPATKFKPLIQNNSGKGLNATPGDNQLSFVMYNEEIQ